MATFMTRIELHNAKYQDYVNLHGHMGREGFTNTITSNQGITYQLPPAEYHFAGNLVGSQVLEKAKRAAAQTGKSYAAVVSEYTGCTWVGLEKVQPHTPARAY